MASSHFSKIAVLQSLPVGELQTGKRLCEDVETLNLFHQRDLDISFHDAPTKSQFLACLTQLQQEAVKGKWPLLHIECHGSEDKTGIVLADRTFLSWSELKPYFTAINVATQCNLLIVLGACYGGYLGEIILPTDRAPCWGMIGPTDEIYPNELLSGFSSFYTELLTTIDGDSSLKFLMSAPLQNGGYYFATALGFFKLAYSKYLVDYCTPSQIDKRAKAMSRQLKRVRSPTQLSKGALKRLLRNTEGPSFEKHLQRFFMFDLYPQNRARFPLSLAQVKKFQKTLILRPRVTRRQAVRI